MARVFLGTFVKSIAKNTDFTAADSSLFRLVSPQHCFPRETPITFTHDYFYYPSLDYDDRGSSRITPHHIHHAGIMNLVRSIDEYYSPKHSSQHTTLLTQRSFTWEHLVACSAPEKPPQTESGYCTIRALWSATCPHRSFVKDVYQGVIKI